MNSYKFFEGEWIGINFKYPKEYKEFLNDKNMIEILDETPWWLIGSSDNFFNICYESINVNFKSTKLLIPFAKSDQSNLLACFDKQHKIWLTSCEKNDITDADWNNRFHLKDFNEWIDFVINQRKG